MWSADCHGDFEEESGLNGFRLVTLRNCFRETNGRLLTTGGTCADAGMIARAAAVARQVAVVEIDQHRAPNGFERRERTLSLAMSLYLAGRRLRIPPPSAEVRGA